MRKELKQQSLETVERERETERDRDRQTEREYLY